MEKILQGMLVNTFLSVDTASFNDNPSQKEYIKTLEIVSILKTYIQILLLL